MSVEEDIAALKQATREAHEAIQESKDVKKELEATWARISEEIENHIESEVAIGLTKYSGSILTAIEDATQRVYERFDLIADILVGEDKQSRRKGLPSITELVEQRVERGRSNETRTPPGR